MEDPLWTDRHRPAIDEFPQQEVRERLDLASRSPLNLFIYGPAGAGKTAAAHAVTRELHDDPENDVVVINVRDFFDRTKKEIREDPRFSSFLQGQTEFSKQYQNSDDRNKYKSDWSKARMFSHVIAETAAIPPAASEYKTIILDNAEELREDLQQSLRRTMERYYESTQFVFTARNAGTVITAIKSRCFLIPVPRPADPEVADVLADIADREGVDVDRSALFSIAARTDGNVREAILTLQTAASQHDEVTKDAVDDALEGVGHVEVAEAILDDAESGELWDARKQVDELIDEEGFDGKAVLKLLSDAAHRRHDDDRTLADLADVAAEVDFRLADAANDRVQLMKYVTAAATA